MHKFFKFKKKITEIDITLIKNIILLQTLSSGHNINIEKLIQFYHSIRNLYLNLYLL